MMHYLCYYGGFGGGVCYIVCNIVCNRGVIKRCYKEVLRCLVGERVLEKFDLF